MIQLYIGETNNVILTLTEKQLLTDPNYLFIFKNRETNVEVKFVKLNNTDTSLFKERYNKFSFNVDALFNPQVRGEYKYQVYEQASTTNTDPTGLNLIETGLMKLNDPRTQFVERLTTNIFIVND